jgi:hypothetical protein
LLVSSRDDVDVALALALVVPDVLASPSARELVACHR